MLQRSLSLGSVEQRAWWLSRVSAGATRGRYGGASGIAEGLGGHIGSWTVGLDLVAQGKVT